MLKNFSIVLQATNLRTCPICCKGVGHLFHHLVRVHKVDDENPRMILMHADMTRADPFKKIRIINSLAKGRNSKANHLARSADFDLAYRQCVSLFSLF